ncbi:MAG: hypothetical protein ACRD1C_03765 [Terriglobales bacterium]
MTWIHDGGWILIAWYAFSSVVSGMPQPADNAGPGYRWLYATLHLLAGNLGNVVKAASPKP